MFAKLKDWCHVITQYDFCAYIALPAIYSSKVHILFQRMPSESKLTAYLTAACKSNYPVTPHSPPRKMVAMPDTDFYSYEPATGHGLNHDPFNAIVGPRPIGWISSIDTKGQVNLAPYSFFNAFNYTPPIVGFASIGWKDTVANIRATGEFVWNLTDQFLAKQMNLTSAAVPHDICEFDLAHLARMPSDLIRPPRVAASPVQFECRMTQIVQLQSAQGERVESWITFGEVVRVHIRRHLVAEGIYNTAAAKPILRAGGLGDYAVIQPQDMFEMPRPQGTQTLERLIRDRASPD